MSSPSPIPQRRRRINNLLSKPIQCSFCERTFNSFVRGYIHHLTQHCKYDFNFHTRINTDKTQSNLDSLENPSKRRKLSFVTKHAKTAQCEFVFATGKHYRKQNVNERMSTLADVAVKELAKRNLLQPFCCYCGQRFLSQAELNKHRKSYHAKVYSCDLCNEKFLLSTEYKRHCSITHNISRPFACDICDRKFVHESALTAHKRTHSNDRPFQCSICDMAFSQSSTLFSHIRRHSGAMPYKCSDCGKSFAVKGDLRTHSHTHKTDKPFTCEICGKSFPRKSNFSRHLRSHTGEKPYSCKHCYKSFSRAEKCQEHERTHTNERPFSCPDCGARFKDSGNFCSHRKLHKNGRQPRKRAVKVPWVVETDIVTESNGQHFISNLITDDGSPQRVVADLQHIMSDTTQEDSVLTPSIEAATPKCETNEVISVNAEREESSEVPVVIKLVQRPTRMPLKPVQTFSVLSGGLKTILLNKTTVNNGDRTTLSNVKQFIPLSDANLQNDMARFSTLSASPDKSVFTLPVEDNDHPMSAYGSDITSLQHSEAESNSLNNQAFLMLDCFPRDSYLSFANDGNNMLLKNSSVFLQPPVSDLSNDASMYSISLMDSDLPSNLSNNLSDSSYITELTSESHSLLADEPSFLNRSDVEVRTTLDTNTFLNDDYFMRSDIRTSNHT